MWRAIAARATGTSHVASGTPCQDRATFEIVDDADGGEAALGIVCDGAGSARYAEIGAELVSTSLRTIAAAFISGHGSAAITAAALEDWLTDIRRCVGERALAEGADIRDYACTMLFAIAGESHTICGQIGDGAIVLRTDGELHVAIWPENGEYANETFFVTQDDAVQRLRVERSGPVSDFVVFSDGLQGIALNDAAKTAHAGFFEPLVGTVRSSNELDVTEGLLESFLGSDRINAKTDDDKSIVIACRID